MSPRRASRSKGGRPPAGLVVLAALAVLALAAYLFGPALLSRTHTVPRAPESVRSSGDRLRAALGDPADPAAAGRVLERAVESAVREEGLSSDCLRQKSGRKGAVPEWELSVPAGTHLLEMNLAITRSVEHAGGTVLDGYAERGAGVWMVIGTESKPLQRVLLRSEPGSEGGAISPSHRIALVVEAGGEGNQEDIGPFLDLGIPLAVSVRAGSSASRETAQRARDAGADVLLQLPMEPKGYPRLDPGRDAILVDLKEGEIRRRIDRQLESLPPVVGVSPRMGSLATQDRRVMSIVLDELKRHRLFFLDNHTTSASVAPEVARQAGLTCLVNTLYLDSENGGAAWVAERLDDAAAAAAKGGVIVTAHARAATASAIARELPRLRRQGLEFVRVSALAAEREGDAS